MQELRVRIDGNLQKTPVTIPDESKPPVVDMETMADIEEQFWVSADRIDNIEYQKADGTWAEVEYER